MLRIESKKTDELFVATAGSTFSVLGLDGDCFVELELVSKQKIRQINAQFRGVDKPTDVLSFPLLSLPEPTATKLKIPVFNAESYRFETNDSGEVLLGSILICTTVAKKNAKEYGHSTERELCYLFVHGLLHLLGFDHMQEHQKKIMRAAEEEILSVIGITRR